MNDKTIQREQQIADKEILVEKYKTAIKKVQFINEIKTGLGGEIKKNPKPKIIRKPFLKRMLDNVKNIFTKF
jgi:hypothetical protein